MVDNRSFRDSSIGCSIDKINFRIVGGIYGWGFWNVDNGMGFWWKE
jgi:hypothetical protein